MAIAEAPTQVRILPLRLGKTPEYMVVSGTKPAFVRKGAEGGGPH